MEWSDVKQEVFRFESDIVVSAGAGSGKTAALVELYLRLLSGETSLPRPLAVEEIVAITFTDKAAVEMKRRVRQAVEERAGRGDGAAEWKRLLRALPAANIATFHAFCSRLLRENPVEAGVDPSFSLLDEMSSGAELDRALDEVIKDEIRAQSAEILLLLSSFPLEGRGEGKGLRDHLLDLHRKRAGSGSDGGDLLRKTAEWDEKARALFADGAEELARLVGEVGRILGGKPLKFHERLAPLPDLHAAAPLALDDPATGARLAAMAECVAGTWGNEKPVKDALLACLETLTCSWSQIQSSPAATALLLLADRLEAAYRLRKERRGALDFEDLQLKTRDLLRRDDELRRECRERFPVVMVDEFQDTNPLQKELVSLLCGPGQRLFLVGDPKQSIYLFRGADVEVFIQAQGEAKSSGGRTLYFQESFRSRQGIVDFVNALFSRVMRDGEAPFEVRYREGDHLEAKRPDWDGAPCVELMRIGREGNAHELRTLEAGVIARKIAWLVSGEGGVRFGDIAILFRRFSNLKLFEQALRRGGIPYYVVKGKGFYRCQEVLDLLNFLKYLDWAGDLPALAGVLRSPLCAVSDETLYLLSRLDGGIGAWEKWFAHSPGRVHRSPIVERIDPCDWERLESLARLLARLRPLRDRLLLPELLEEIVTAADFASTLLATYQGGQKVANLRKLIELSRSFSGEGGDTSFHAFVGYLAGLVEEEPVEAEAVIAAEGENVVRLMTVHQSKGLEFPIVFIPETGGSPPPDTSPVQYDPALGLGAKCAPPGSEAGPSLAFRAISGLRRAKEGAELKRLFYVAATRAMDYLILSGEGKGAWRVWLDAFLADGGASLLKLTEAPEGAEEGEAPVPLPRQASPPSGEKLALALRRSLAYVAPLPGDMAFSPTALEDYRNCPRKYFYKAVLGLDEGLFADLLAGNGRGGKGRAGGKGMTPLEKGNLAHAMLEVLDFAAGREEQLARCRRVAAVMAEEPDGADAAEVTERVLALAASPLGAELAGKRLMREHPFVLRLSGAAAYHIRGTMDLVAEENGRVTVYDYKYAAAGEADLEGYRFQLRTYMLALAAAFPGREVAGKLLFLKGGKMEEVACDPGEVERELLAIMDAILVRREEGEFPLRGGCDGSHCPFRRRCQKTPEQ